MKNVLKITLVASLVSLVSCQNTNQPNYQFFPNMYQSVGYETYAESESFDGPNQLNGQTAQLPPNGTIKRGFEIYDIENTTEGYNASKLINVSALDSISPKDAAKGKELYDIYCAICHGANGNGKGKLVEREKFLGVPSYADREISVGSIFHVVTYGLNSMGSHASQLTPRERWLVSDYVLKLKSEL